MKDFFDKIPKAPGHYCRKDSQKMLTRHGVSDPNINFFPLQSSMSIFMKIIFHFLRGKKTTAIRVLHMSQTEFNMLQKRKNDALNMKEEDKKMIM